MHNLKAIVAKTDDNIIGINGQLPWHNPTDLKHFKDTTMGDWVIMGRKTVETLPKTGLTGRKIIALTNDLSWSDSRCTLIFRNIDVLLDWLSISPESDVFWVAGGQSIYEQLLPYCNEQIVTCIQSEIPYSEDYAVAKYPSNYGDGFVLEMIKTLHGEYPIKIHKYKKKS